MNMKKKVSILWEKNRLFLITITISCSTYYTYLVWFDTAVQAKEDKQACVCSVYCILYYVILHQTFWLALM